MDEETKKLVLMLKESMALLPMGQLETTYQNEGNIERYESLRLEIKDLWEKIKDVLAPYGITIDTTLAEIEDM